MSELRITPGPWHVSANTYTVFAASGFQVCDPEQGPHVSEQWETDVQDLSNYRHWAGGEGTDYRTVPDEEIEANARLIAAAPELLDAFQQILSLEPDYTCPEEYVRLVRRLATSAIKKATS